MTYEVRFTSSNGFGCEHHLAERDGDQLIIVTDTGEVQTLEEAWRRFRPHAGERPLLGVWPEAEFTLIPAESGWVARFAFDGEPGTTDYAVLAWRWEVTPGIAYDGLDAVICRPDGDLGEANRREALEADVAGASFLGYFRVSPA